MGYKVKRIYQGTNLVRPSYKTFTISWTEQSNMSSGWTYSDDAAGLTAGSTEFDKFFGYYGCRLSNIGLETAKINQEGSGGYGKLDITQLGALTSGDNVMIAFPRRGIKMSKSGSVVTLSITSDPNKVGYQYYAHTKGNNSINTLYLGAYKIVSGYKSLSGQAPLHNLKRSQYRSSIKSTYDSSAGTNRYSQISIYARWYINALYMMKYGNPNSQSVIGMGNTTGSSLLNTGGTNSQTSASYGTSNTNQQVKLFGLEDWWGNVNEHIDCCWWNANTQLTVDKTNSIFQDSDYSTNLGVTAGSGYASSIDGSNDGMFMCTSTSGGAAFDYYTDYNDSYASCLPITGGSTNDSNKYMTGFLKIEAAYPSYTASGARLMYL